MALIRAFALHIPVTEPKPNKIIEMSIRLLDGATRCCKAVGCSPWTWRIVFPPLPDDIEYQDVKRIAMEIYSSFSNIDVLMAIPFKIDSPHIDKIVNLIYENSYIYSSTVCNNETCVQKIASSIYSKFKDIGIDVYTNFAVAFGSWVESPYFPATANTSNNVGFSCSLRYVDLVKKSLVDGNENDVSKFIISIDSLLKSISSCMMVPYLGIDASLSPWLNESVAEIVEILIGDRLGSLGSFNAIYILNRYIRELIDKLKIKSIGYNEVMLSVAEDLLLNEYVSDGRIRLKDLMSFSLFCVPGVDMIAMPHQVDYRRFLLDMLTIYRVKKISTALRVIPTELESGTKIILRRFGETYVIHI